VPTQPETATTSVESTENALTARFSPDLVRRAGALLGRIVGPRLFGPGQRMRASQFATVGATPGHIVFLGDSITQGGLWPEWFAGVPVLNRGVDAETSEDLLRRVDTAVRDPRAVFLLIGTNDLNTGVSLQQVIANVRALLAEIERRAPGTPVVVQSVMPRTPRFRDDLRLLNRAYRQLVDRSAENVEYLDLWPALADEDGDLRREYTEDGLHLNGPGYAAWVGALRPLVDRLSAGRGR
jgi:lysophospholipase L1-like esterase